MDLPPPPPLYIGDHTTLSEEWRGEGVGVRRRVYKRGRRTGQVYIPLLDTRQAARRQHSQLKSISKMAREFYVFRRLFFSYKLSTCYFCKNKYFCTSENSLSAVREVEHQISWSFDYLNGVFVFGWQSEVLIIWTGFLFLGGSLKIWLFERGFCFWVAVWSFSYLNGVFVFGC